MHASQRQQQSTATVAGIEILERRVRRLATAGRLRVDERRAVGMIHAAGTGTILALLGTPAGERDLGLADAMVDATVKAIFSDVPATTPLDTVTIAMPP